MLKIHTKIWWLVYAVTYREFRVAPADTDDSRPFSRTNFYSAHESAANARPIGKIPTYRFRTICGFMAELKKDDDMRVFVCRAASTL